MYPFGHHKKPRRHLSKAGCILILRVFLLLCFVLSEGMLCMNTWALNESSYSSGAQSRINGISSFGKHYSNLERRISMDFKDAGLKDVLKIFSQQAGLNFVAAEGIEDITLTLYLADVSVKEALDKLLSANNLIYELDFESDIFVVKRSPFPGIKTITRVFYLKFARVPGSRLAKEITQGIASQEVSLTGGGGGEGGGGPESKTGILEVIKNILTEYGKIDVDVRTNSLIITDIPERFPLIEGVIAELDACLPQVMIEVEMLDVSKQTIDKLGMTFGEQLLSISGSSVRNKFPFWGNEFEKGKSSPFAASDTNFGYGKLDSTMFSVVFKSLITDKGTKFLARPRILTLSNETAEIKIITDEVIGLKVESVSSEGVTTSSEEAERGETGISLRVTPQVDISSSDITMFLQPIVAEAFLSDITSVTGQTYKNPEIRTTKSTVRMKDGETLIVGGLIRAKKDETRRKVPLFSNIPILGMLFRDKDQTDTDRELIVFITPHILEETQMGMAKSFGLSELTSGRVFPSGTELYREQTLSGRESDVEQVLKQYENR